MFYNIDYSLREEEGEGRKVFFVDFVHDIKTTTSKTTSTTTTMKTFRENFFLSFCFKEIKMVREVASVVLVVVLLVLVVVLLVLVLVLVA